PQDLSQEDAADRVFAECEKQGLKINFLINNAGIGYIENFDTHDLKKIQEMITLNITTLTKLCYLFLPQLTENQGSILNVASQVAFEPVPQMAVYGATKSYVLNFTEALRVECEDKQVKVSALCPGPVYTRFYEKSNTTPEIIRFKFRNADEVVS